MISDNLYTMAFKFRKKRVWDTIGNVHVFAIKFSDRTIGYTNITHSSNGLYSLGLYLGDKGFNSLRTIIELDRLLISPFSPFKFQEMILQQECLKCIFVTKNQLLEEELNEIKNYTNSHGIRLSGKNAYPQFIKYIPNHIPFTSLTDQEQKYLCEALSVSVALTDMIEGGIVSLSEITEISDDSKEIFSMELKDDEFRIGKVPYPELLTPQYPCPKARNDIAIARLKREKKIGIWECELIRFPRPIQNNPEEIPFYPVYLIAVECSTGYFLPILPVQDYEEDPEKLMNLFIDTFLEQKICPAEIKVRDKRSYLFAEDLCQKLKIPLNMENSLEALEETEFEFWNRFGIPNEEDDSSNTLQ